MLTGPAREADISIFTYIQQKDCLNFVISQKIFIYNLRILNLYTPLILRIEKSILNFRLLALETFKKIEICLFKFQIV